MPLEAVLGSAGLVETNFLHTFALLFQTPLAVESAVVGEWWRYGPVLNERDKDRKTQKGQGSSGRRGLSYQHRRPGTSLKQHLQAESACYLEQVNSNGPNVLVWAHFDGG